MAHRLAGFLLLVMAGLPLTCAQGQETAGVKADLGETQRRIRALQEEISATEDAYSEATNALRESERAVSEARRKLAAAARGLQKARRRVEETSAEGGRVRQRIASRRTELKRWLSTHYVYGRVSGLAQLLGGAADIESMARRVYYLEQVGRARFHLIESLRAELQRNEALSTELRAREQELAALEKGHEQQKAELETLAQARRAAAEKLSAQLSTQRQEVANLKQDEVRLSKLLEELARLAREQRRLQREKELGAGEVVVRRQPVPFSQPSDVAFETLRGQLRMPVKGEVTARFGSSRSGGGTTWKGIFIRANVGVEVKAVADGSVVFSDWLRGFGNLLIVDHGDQYMTVYGNNDVLLKTTGDTVAAGEIIANVGASGGGEDSGLYFEIRYRADPQDPMKWLLGGG